MKKKNIILTFHGIGKNLIDIDDEEKKVWVKKEIFHDLCSFASGRNDIIITFDDGNISDYDIAFPILIEMNLKGIFFIVANKIGQKGYLDEKHLKEMSTYGMTIGLHGMYHRSWRGLTKEELFAELIDAREKIASIIGKKVNDAACPFGAYDRQVIKKLLELDYNRIYTSDGGLADKESWFLPRNTIHHNDNLNIVSKKISKYLNSNITALIPAFKGFIKRNRPRISSKNK